MGERSGDLATGSQAAARPPACTLVAAALEIEIGAVRTRRHRLEREGALSLWWPPEPGAPVLAVTGMGRAATEENLERALERVAARRLLVIGLAGGCRAALRPGALVLATRLLPDIALGSEQRPLPACPPIELAAPAPAWIDALRSRTAVHCGTVVTTSVIARPSAKASLGRNLGALACDMESYWAARLARARGVEVRVARVVFDALEHALPPVGPGVGVWELVRRPWTALSLPRLGWRVQRCRQVLREAVAVLGGR